MEDSRYELVEPRASSLVEALRSVGYSLQTAIADLIDNSITASARTVRVRFHWNGADSWLAISDDGHGMSDVELAEAMRPGSSDPLQARSPADLGRFGLGLKTAAFSQARSLTVASRRAAGSLSVRRWDLDYIREAGEWRLLKDVRPGSESRLAELEPAGAGTVVLLEKLDRIVGAARLEDTAAQNRFNRAIDDVDRHLGMVFHQFLAPPAPAQRLGLFINGTAERNRVRAWDPFMEAHLATFSPSDAERLSFAGRDVFLKGFVLPHKDRLTAEEYQRGAGPAGWNAQQGFYVYRNRRLLVPGGWLDLGFTNEEHHKLARIRVDIPNSTDAEWSIDVKKSRARPPAALRPRLKEVADVVRRKAREVYAHRGRVAAGAPETMQRPWVSATRSGRIMYRVDREHPLARHVLGSTPPALRPAMDAFLRLLEETVPVQQIWLDAAEKSEPHSTPFEGEPDAQTREVMRQVFRALRAEGASGDLARKRLASMPPFDRFPALVATIKDAT